MYQTLPLSNYFDELFRKTLQVEIYYIVKEITKADGSETLQYIYELDRLGKLVKHDLVTFLKSEYDIDQLRNSINEHNGVADNIFLIAHEMLQTISNRIIHEIINLNDGLKRLEDLHDIYLEGNLTNLELIEYLQDEKPSYDSNYNFDYTAHLNNFDYTAYSDYTVHL